MLSLVGASLMVDGYMAFLFHTLQFPFFLAPQSQKNDPSLE